MAFLRKVIKKAPIIAPLGAGYYLFSTVSHNIEPVGPPYQILPKIPYDQHPNKHIISKILKTIGVLGGGVAGLVSAKTFKLQGYDVELIEKNPGVGGVWYKNYDNAGLQGPKETYHIPDFPIPESYPTFPKQGQLKAWLEAYAEKFNLNSICSFNKEVKNITQNPDETWKLTFSDGTSKDYDFLVVAAGLHNNPNIPKFKGQEKFKGKILHSSQFINAKHLCENKNVIVVGSGKSAFDIMNTTLEYGGKPTGLIRTVGYSFPEEEKPYGIPFWMTLSSRFMYTFGIIFDTENSFVHKYLYPLEWLLLKFMDLQFRYKAIDAFQPDDQKLHMIETAGLRQEQTQENIRNGKIKTIKGTISEIQENGVIVNGKFIEADTIIYATGFNVQYFVEPLKEDGFWSYKHMIIPGKRNVAFVGAFITIATSMWFNIQAIWINDVLRGHVKVPSIEEMNKDIEKRKKEMFAYYPAYKHKPLFISSQTYSPFYVDELLKEMGIKHIREKSRFRHWLYPFDTKKYESVATHHI